MTMVEAGTFVTPAQYSKYRDLQQTVNVSQTLVTQAEIRNKFLEEYLYQSQQVDIFNPRSILQNQSAAQRVLSTFSTELNEAQAGRGEALKARATFASKIAGILIKDHWAALTPLERRLADISASKSRVEDTTRLRTAEQDLFEGLYYGYRLHERQYGIYHYLQVADSWRQNNGLNLRPLDDIGNDVYASSKGPWTRILGSTIFGVIRAAKMVAPQITVPIAAPAGSRFAKEEYSKNQKAILGYFDQAIKTGKAHVYDSQGLELALNPHFTQPYTDTDWERSLSAALKVVPQVAKVLGEECPEIIGLTVYGGIARPHKDYAMFHPDEAIQLGAFFEDGADVAKALELVKSLEADYKVRIKPGTSRINRRAGERYRTWDFSSIGQLLDYEKALKGSTSFKDAKFYLEAIGEVVLQVGNGYPIYVRDDEFTRIQSQLNRLKSKYVDPVFNHALFLYDMMESGYPQPLETRIRPN